MGLREPLNVLSSLVFIVVAIILWYRFRDSRKKYIPLLLSIVLIGIMSTIHHSNHSSLSLLLDTGAAYLFAILFLYVALSKKSHLRRYVYTIAPVAVGVILIAKILIPNNFDTTDTITSAIFRAVLASFLYFAYGRRSREVTLMWIFITTGILVHALDSYICHIFPLGTHFLWHILSALAVYTGVSLFVHREQGA